MNDYDFIESKAQPPASMRELLVNLGLIDETKLVREWGQPEDPFWMTQDRASGIIFLEGQPAMDYATNPGLSYWDAETIEDARSKTFNDDRRRAHDFGKILFDKRVLEFGCGNGGFIRRFPGAEAVEIQEDTRGLLQDSGLTIHDRIPRAGSCEPFDVVVSFHVLEHLPDPIGTLRQLHAILKPGGKIILEVPHAKDFLQEFLNLDCFREKSYRGEHLLLHTEASLTKFLEVSGFKNIKVEGYQRHSLNCHLHYAAKRAPGPNIETWDFLLTPTIKREYAEIMAKIGMTDTLIAIAEA